VRAEHDDLVGFGFVVAGYFANDVERIQIVVVELVLDIELQRDRHFLLEQSIDAPVVCSLATAMRGGAAGSFSLSRPPPC